MTRPNGRGRAWAKGRAQPSHGGEYHGNAITPAQADVIALDVLRLVSELVEHAPKPTPPPIPEDTRPECHVWFCPPDLVEWHRVNGSWKA